MPSLAINDLTFPQVPIFRVPIKGVQHRYYVWQVASWQATEQGFRVARGQTTKGAVEVTKAWDDCTEVAI